MATTLTKPAITRQQITFLLLCVGRFMVVLDSTIVNVALPSIEHAFGFSTQVLQWVVTIYSLTFGGVLLLSGRAGDLFGRRLLFIVGLAIFSLASLAGGFAPSGIWFITARAIEGLGAALLAPTALALITTSFAEGPARNRALSITGSISTFGFAAGGLLGGLLVAGPGWRWVMFVNVPVGIVTIALAPFFLQKSNLQQTGHRHIDVVGAILVTAGLITLVYILAQGNDFGWLSLQTISLFVLMLVLFTAFVVVEMHSPAPLIRLSIFRLRTLTGGNLVSLLCVAAFGALMFVLTLYMQNVLGYSAINTGLAFLPLAAVVMVIANLAPHMVARVGIKPLLVGGMAISAVGFLLFTRISAQGSYLEAVLPGMLVVAFGLSFVFPCLFIAATTGVSASEQGLASGLINTTQQIGVSIGVAVTASVSTARTAALISSGEATGNAALVGGFQSAFLVCIGLAIAATLVALVVVHEGTCRDHLATLVPTEHHHSVRPLAIHLRQIATQRVHPGA